MTSQPRASRDAARPQRRVPKIGRLSRTESSKSSSWAEVESQTEKPERKQRRILQNFARLFLRVRFFQANSLADKVLQHWEKIALRDDQEDDRTPSTEKKKKPKEAQKKRDDLCYVGNPIPRARTAKQYPLDQEHCTHLSLLQAAGGKMGTEKFYYWVCRGCGNRWMRASAAEATAGTGQQEQTVPDGGYRQAIQPKAPPSAPPTGLSATRSSATPQGLSATSPSATSSRQSATQSVPLTPDEIETATAIEVDQEEEVIPIATA